MSDFEAEFARRNSLAHVLAMARCLKDPTFPDMRHTAETMAIKNLPLLRAEDAVWIDRGEMLSLLEALDPARLPLTRAILAAVGKVGDKRALPYVFALAKALDRTLNWMMSDEMIVVRAAAGDCMARLREHAAREQESGALLRGSQQPIDPARSTLLRAANGASSSGSEELLRPGDRGASEIVRRERDDDKAF